MTQGRTVTLFLLISIVAACSSPVAKPAAKTALAGPELRKARSAASLNTTDRHTERMERDQAEPQEADTPANDRTGATPPEYEQPNRWGLTSEGSQRRDWLDDQNP